ncbi:unnamed protein product [Prunus armeniaca]
MLWASAGVPALQDRKRSVRPRAPVWYQPKALRCLSKYMDEAMVSMPKVPVTSILGLVPPFISLGRCVCCVEFRCGTVDIHCGCSTCPEGDFALIMRSVGLGAMGFPTDALFCPCVLLLLAIAFGVNKIPPRS